MTKKERLFVLTLVITMFGFSVFGLIDSKENRNVSQIRFEIEAKSEKDVNDDYDNYKNSQNRFKDSRMISMLSKVLEIPKVDIWNALNGGLTPAELLSDSGVLLSDLQEEYNFQIVHDQFVKFA